MTEKKSEVRRPDPWVEEATKAVPTSLVKQIVNDFKNGPSRPSSMLGPEKTEVVKPVGSGWQQPAPLSPPNTYYLDKLMDHQDAIDRRELKRRLGVTDEKPAEK
jgi:hypothetical protein